MSASTKRPLSRRHRDAIMAIARAKHGATDAQVRKAIGSYATNVIKSLEERDLITWQLREELEKHGGAWVLTARGHELLQQMADAERAS